MEGEKCVLMQTNESHKVYIHSLYDLYIYIYILKNKLVVRNALFPCYVQLN